MAINIRFEDFDTVCYSKQHNIIQLIKGSVGLSVEVNINASNITNLGNRVDSIQDQVQQVGQEGHDAWLLAQSLNVDVSAIKFNTTAMWENNIYFQSSPLGIRINDLQNRVEDLERRLNEST